MLYRSIERASSLVPFHSQNPVLRPHSSPSSYLISSPRWSPSLYSVWTLCCKGSPGGSGTCHGSPACNWGHTCALWDPQGDIHSGIHRTIPRSWSDHGCSWGHACPHSRPTAGNLHSALTPAWSRSPQAWSTRSSAIQQSESGCPLTTAPGYGPFRSRIYGNLAWCSTHADGAWFHHHRRLYKAFQLCNRISPPECQTVSRKIHTATGRGGRREESKIIMTEMEGGEWFMLLIN